MASSGTTPWAGAKLQQEGGAEDSVDGLGQACGAGMRSGREWLGVEGTAAPCPYEEESKSQRVAVWVKRSPFSMKPKATRGRTTKNPVPFMSQEYFLL